MKTKKDLYETPSTEVFEVKTECVICQSGLEPLSPFEPISGDPLIP